MTTEQSRECQREDWKSHKERCKYATNADHTLMERFGADMVERHRSFKKWCDRNRIAINFAGMLALKTRSSSTQIGMYLGSYLLLSCHHKIGFLLMSMFVWTDTHVFVIIVDTTIEDSNPGSSTSLITTSSFKSQSPPKFNRTIRHAASVPIDEALDKYLPWFDSEARTFFKQTQPTNLTLGPDAKFLRILIIDDSLPEPMSTLSRPAVIKPEHTAAAPPGANDEAMWRPFLEYMVQANEH